MSDTTLRQQSYRAQARKFGAEVAVPVEVARVEYRGTIMRRRLDIGCKWITADATESLTCRACCATKGATAIQALHAVLAS